MQVKIEGTAPELKPLKGEDGELRYIPGPPKPYNKVVDLELNGAIAKFTQPQTPPAPAQRPPTPPPTNGHTPRWATREDAVEAYIFYATELGQYIPEPAALVRAVNCLVMQEADGEINPVHRPRKERGVSHDR